MTPRGSGGNEGFCVDQPQVPTTSFFRKMVARIQVGVKLTLSRGVGGQGSLSLLFYRLRKHF